eukprot:88942-Hanusia_phi.AAC.1
MTVKRFSPHPSLPFFHYPFLYRNELEDGRSSFAQPPPTTNLRLFISSSSASYSSATSSVIDGCPVFVLSVPCILLLFHGPPPQLRAPKLMFCTLGLW